MHIPSVAFSQNKQKLINFISFDFELRVAPHSSVCAPSLLHRQQYTSLTFCPMQMNNNQLSVSLRFRIAGEYVFLFFFLFFYCSFTFSFCSSLVSLTMCLIFFPLHSNFDSMRCVVHANKATFPLTMYPESRT